MNISLASCSAGEIVRDIGRDSVSILAKEDGKVHPFEFSGCTPFPRAIDECLKSREFEGRARGARAGFEQGAARERPLQPTGPTKGTVAPPRWHGEIPPQTFQAHLSARADGARSARCLGTFLCGGAAANGMAQSSPADSGSLK